MATPATSPSLALLKQQGKPENTGAAKPAAAPAAAKPAAAPKNGGAPPTSAAPPKPKPAAKPPAAAAPAPAEEETVLIETKDMTSEQLDALIKEHGIKAPSSWAKMDQKAKVAWLEENYGDGAGEAEPAAEAPPPAAAKETPAEKPKAPAPAKEAAKEPAAEKPKPAASAEAKAGSKQVTKVLHGDVIGPGKISDIVFTIENLKEKDARALVGRLTDHAEFSYITLGGVLSKIQSSGWYTPHASFREFVENEHGMKFRRALHWIEVYNKLSEEKIPWEKVAQLGWTKMSVIVKVINSDNIDEWVALAEKQTTIQLQETVKAAMAKVVGEGSAEGTEVAKTVTTKTFKLHEEQRQTVETALEKAKEASGTTYDAVALEYICLDFLGAAKPSLADQLKALGDPLKAANMLSAAYPETDFDVKLPEGADA